MLARWGLQTTSVKMASSNETVLLKSTLEIQNKAFSVKLTSSEIYWETITSARASGGPYSEPLVQNPHSTQHYVTFPQPQSASDLHTSGHNKAQQPFDNRMHSSIQPRDTLELPSHSQSEFSSLCSQTCAKEKAFNLGRTWRRCLRLCRCSCCCSCCSCCKTENQTVKLNEILAVKLDTKSSGSDGKFQHVEMVALQSTAFVIYVIRRLSKHRWRHRAITFHSKDSAVIQQWVEKIGEIINKTDFKRPKHLLVFINPYGGKKRGPKIYHDKVAPLFDLAGITTEVIVTQRANHARDTLLEYDLSKVDGVVCVGGDGMFSELMHGMLTRSMREAGLDHLTPANRPIPPKLRIGIIPGGSTDTVAWTVHGCNDPVTSALHIVIGDSIALDVATVHHDNQFLRYNISLLGYGFYGDCLLDSEQNRWMGPKRYNWAGFKKVLGNTSYEGEISFLPSPDKDNHPRDGTRCRAGCQVCQAVRDSDQGQQPTARSTAPVTEEEIVLSKDGWQKVKGRFIAINSFVISCKCALSPDGPCPCSHLGDGCLDLILIKDCSRLEYTKHLVKCMDKTADQYDLPFISTYRVREFRFRPLLDDTEDTHEASDSKPDGQQRLRSKVTRNSVWNCDGELVNESSIDVRAYPQIIPVFGRGVEDEVTDDAGGCMSCSCGGNT